MTKILSRLTNHAKWPDGTLAGGIPEITQADVAAACRGMTKHLYYYARLKFCFDGTVKDELKQLNRDVVIYRAKLEGWRVSDNQAQALADLALQESISPRSCKTCHGSGLQHNQKQCPACKGKGFIGAKGRDCAKAMGISAATWSQVWQRRFDNILSEFVYFDDLIYRHIRREIHSGIDT